MKVSFKWLNKYANLDGVSAKDVAEALPMLGLEVESTASTGLGRLENVVVGEILSRVAHENSDHLGVCSVDVGRAKPLQIVCGANNYKPGDRVPVALEGARLPAGGGNFIEIKKTKLRGVESCGMMCSAREIGLGDDHSGLLILGGRPKPGTPINEVFEDSDTVFEIELTANRGDCLSHIGVARELAAKFGAKLKKPPLKYNPEYSANPDGEILKTVRVESPNCPLYTAVAVKGVRIGVSPRWLARDLEAAGLRSINNVVDVTNYVLLEYGQPLHSFDAEKIRGREIIVRQASDGEPIRTLDGKEYKLTPGALLICDAEGPIGLAGIMGGLDSEVTESTRNVVIESAYFNPGNIRATSRKYSVNTDASYRFARDVDPEALFEASRRAVDLILETAGGEVVGGTCVVGKPPRGKRTIEISDKYVSDRAGFEVSGKDMADVFGRLGFEVDDLGGGKLSVKVGTFRPDVERPVDLLEEFVRVWGTDKIPDSEIKCPAPMRDDDPLFKFNTAVADYLSSIGLNECQNYTLRDGSAVEKLHENARFNRLANPLASDQDCLRASLIDGLLDTVRLNSANGNDFKGFFECGRIFSADKDGVLTETAAVGFTAVVGGGARKWRTREPFDFFGAKQTVFDILSILGVNPEKLNLAETRGSMWQKSFAAECGSVEREGFSARFGAVDAGLLRSLGIDRPVYAGEVSFKPEIAARRRGPEKFKPFSAFPPASRDMAVIAKDAERASDVRGEILRAAKRAVKNADFELEGVELFDVYKGDGVPDGCKSLAFELKFRSPKKTLQAEDVNRVFDEILAEISGKRKLRTA